ncbi:ankyrin repeat-containing domain protein [Zopfochytrium polystomum]|nr:ankyrin repeat-containing domain protein [Zopfochytrium polystomum]
MKASSHNRPDVVRFLLDRHANVNHSDHHGWTALHSSVSSGNEEIAWLLINAGADVNARSRDGLTPLS